MCYAPYGLQQRGRDEKYCMGIVWREKQKNWVGVLGRCLLISWNSP
jgi:hypothetical protein